MVAVANALLLLVLLTSAGIAASDPGDVVDLRKQATAAPPLGEAEAAIR